jgi:hypothetical protein
MWGYIPTLVTVFLAGLQLAKDWGAHQATWRRITVLVLIILLGIGGAVNTFYANKRALNLNTTNQAVIASLQRAVETANRNQADNTKQYVESYGALSQKLSDLQSQLKTAGLSKEAASLRTELESTRKALEPPTAELEASLGTVTDKLENLEVKEIPVTSSLDGTLSFTITVANKSKVQANNGSVFVRICEQCTFAEEPARFIKPVGAPIYDREMPFQVVNVGTGLAIPLKIKPPVAFSRRIEIAVTLRCNNCLVGPAQNLYIDY